jgi:cell division transport system permease protein
MLKHALSGGFKNLTRSLWISLTAITILTVSLASVAFVASLSTVAGFTLRQFDNKISILAYFREDVEDGVIKTATDEIRSNSDVKEVAYISKEEAKKDLEKTEAGRKTIKTVTDNTGKNRLLNYLNITPTSAESYSKVINTLNGTRFKSLWDGNIENKQEFISSLQKAYRYTNYAGIALIVIFAIVSILVLINILQITIFHRKDEIEIMRLVGATNGYIRGPFIVEGALYNIIASLIIAVIFLPSISLLIPWIESYLKIGESQATSGLILQMYLTLLGTIILGTLTGVITAYFATKRYLKL